MTAPAFKAASSGTDETGAQSTIAVTRPTVADGDVLLAFATVPATSPGWTLIHSGGPFRVSVLRRAIPAASEEPGSYTFTGSWNGGGIVVASYGGPFAVPPEVVIGTPGPALRPVISGITTPTDDVRLIAAVVMSAPQGPAVAGMTYRAGSMEPPFVGMRVFDEVAVAAGATGDREVSGWTGVHGSLMVGLVPGSAAPYAPKLLSPASGGYVDFGTEEGRTFSWLHAAPQVGDVQTAWSFRRTTPGVEPTVEWWDATGEDWSDTEVWNSGDDASVTFPDTAGWANGASYTWAVATENAVDVGPYSDDRAVTGNTAPVMAFTEPSAPVTDSTQPTLEWTFTDAEADAKDAHRLWVHTAEAAEAPGFDPELATPVWDSGVVLSAATAQQIGTALANDTTYAVFGRSRQAGGLWSELTDAYEVSIDLVATPAPTLTAVWSAENARVDLTVTPSEDEPTTDRVSVQRSLDSGLVWATVPTLGDLEAAGPVVLEDRFAPFNTSVLYRAVAHRDVETSVITSEPSATVEVTTVARSSWLRSLDDATLDTAVSVARGFSLRHPRPSEVHLPAGQKRAVVLRRERYGAQIEPIGFTVMSTAEREALLDILDSGGKLLLQDVLGLQWWVEVAGDDVLTRIVAAPTSADVALGRPVRDAHTLTVPMVEVAAP